MIFANLSAGRGRARAQIENVRAVFASDDVPAEIVFTASPSEMKQRVQEALKTASRILVALGGDGTLHGVVNAAADAGRLSDTIFGVLPAGGGNDFALTLGLPNNPVHAARLLLRGNVMRVDLAHAQTADGKASFYLGGGGLGLDAVAARLASTTYRNWPGRSRYLVAAIRALRNFQPLNLRIEFPGSELPAVSLRALLAAVLNTPAYGAGLRLAPDASITDSALNLVVVRDLRFLQVLNVLSRLLFVAQLTPWQARRFCVRRVRLSAEAPAIFHGDGEILGPAPVEVEIYPGALQILAP